MSRLKVKVETYPSRCEICHQADLFDAQAGQCQRCRDIPAAQLATPATPELTQVQRTYARAQMIWRLALVRTQLSNQVCLQFTLAFITLLFIFGLMISSTIERPTRTIPFTRPPSASDLPEPAQPPAPPQSDSRRPLGENDNPPS